MIGNRLGSPSALSVASFCGRVQETCMPGRSISSLVFRKSQAPQDAQQEHQVIVRESIIRSERNLRNSDGLALRFNLLMDSARVSGDPAWIVL